MSQDKEIIARYTDQPASLPAWIRKHVEEKWNGQAVLLYGLADLDATMKLTQNWLVLGATQVAFVRVNHHELLLQSFERASITAVRERPGLSCTTLTLIGSSENDEPALAVVRFTHRQRRAMANLQFVLEQQLKGHIVPLQDADRVYAEATAHAVKQAQAAVTKNKLAVVLRLLTYLKPYRRKLVIGMTGASLMTLVSLVPAYLTGHMIDKIVRPYENGTLTHEMAWKLGWLTVISIAAAYVLRESFAWVRFRTMSLLGEEVARDLRDEVYEHLQKLSISFFSSKQTGSLISRITSDTDRIWDFIAFGVVEVSVSMIMLGALSGVLLFLDWRLGLMMTVSVPFLLFMIFRHGQRMQALFLRAWRKWSSLTDVLSETIPGVRVVKAFNQEEHEKKRFSGRNKSVVGEFNRIHQAWTSFWPLLMFSTHGVIILVWIFALPRILGDSPHPLSAGTFVSFLFYMTMFAQPIEVIGQMARMLNRATSSAYRVFELLDTEPTMNEIAEPVRLTPLQGHVVFENVSFGYDGVRQVLKGVSFEVKQGEMIGLVGPSGSGKTTLINLIARFYDSTGGKILIDGTEIQNLEVGHFRQQIGMVLQDPYLFHGTVLDNIRYGMPDASFDEVVMAARAANAHDFVGKLPHGYDTIVGERGHTLSGGERQRVSIARAVLHNPRILILDEATSSVDTETERKIQEALDRLVKGRTVFAIAHRLSTLTKASRLIVLESGRISEEGTHAELLAKEGGTYRKLHRLQQELHEIYAV